MILFPRAPRRPRRQECLQDCPARETGDPVDCSCAEQLDRLYDDACEQAYDEWKERE
jgi:hypothetical protein